MRRRVVRVARLGGGSVLIVVGVISGFLPVLQGWLFILLGLSIMAPESETAHRWLEWAKEKVRSQGGKLPGNLDDKGTDDQ